MTDKQILSKLREVIEIDILGFGSSNIVKIIKKFINSQRILNTEQESINTQQARINETQKQTNKVMLDNIEALKAHTNYTPVIFVTSVSVSPSTLSLEENEKGQLSTTILPTNATYKGGTWSSDDEAIATVTVNGLVTGISEGEAIITFTSDDGAKTSTSTITVTEDAVVVDNTPPSVPNELVTSNITNTTVTLDWTASTDNIAVSGYEVYVDGVLEGTSSDTNHIITGLTPDTSYDLTVLAVDTSNNKSNQSAITTVSTTNTAQTPLAFPSARGGGAYATGGRGGNVYHVTNLNDSGAGSLRDAASQPRPATIVYDVSGTVDLKKVDNTPNWLDITGSDLTIAGQTAPLGGITITSTVGSRFRFRGDVENIIMRYMAVRPLDSPSDAFEIFPSNYARNIILDHCSMSYGGDETASMRGESGAQIHNITFQRMLIAEGKTGCLFGSSDEPENCYDNSYLNSLFFNISHRTPNVSSDNRVDIINNVIHDWQYRLTAALGGVKLNHINNFYSLGSRTSFVGGSSQRQSNQLVPENANEVYTAGNYVDKGFLTDPLANNEFLWGEFYDPITNTWQLNPAPSTEFVSSAHPLIGEPLSIKSATDAYADVIIDSGAYKSLNEDGTVSIDNDNQDAFYKSIMAQGEGAFHPYQMSGSGPSAVRTWFDDPMYGVFVNSISSTPINTRPAGFYVSNPHIPEAYLVAKGLTGTATIHNDISDDGVYTWLERYLNEVG